MPEKRDYVAPVKRLNFWVYSLDAPAVRKVHLWAAKADPKTRKDNIWRFEVRVPDRLPWADRWLVWASGDTLCAKPQSREGVSARTVIPISLPHMFPYNGTLDLLPLIG